MARGSKAPAVVVAAAVAALCLRQACFVPPARPAPLAAAAGAAALLGAAPAHADKLGDASKKLADASYPLLKQVDWTKAPTLTNFLTKAAGSSNPKALAKAADSLLEVSDAFDPALIKKAIAAHDVALDHALNQPGLVTPLADHEAVTEAIARMLASAPPAKVMAVFNAFAAVGLKDLNAQWYSTVTSSDAQAAYKAFLELKDVVKASR